MLFDPDLRKIFSTILLIVFVASSYFCLGLLGLQLAIPPSQAGAVWPPAGIALAATILYGPKIWPGIFIGNFVISAWAFGFNVESLPIYIATGTGATINAYVAFRLIQYYLGIPNDLIREKDIFLFLIIGGPLSCLIPPTVGICSMYFAGIIALPEIPVNWFSWWVGDTIGVLIFTPLVLTLFYKDRPVWKRRRYTLTLPLLLTFILVLIFFFYVQKLENNRQQQQFIDHTKNITQTINTRIQNHIRNIQSIHNFFVNSEQIEELEFKSFTKSTLKQFSELKLIRWIKYDPDKGLSTEYYEKKQETNIDTNYLPDNLLPLLTRNFILTSTSSLFLREDKNTMDLFTSVYENANDKLINFIGVIAISFSIDDLLANALLNQPFHEINLSIVETASGKQIYHNTQSTKFNNIQKFTINLANQKWLLTFSSNNHIDNESHWSMWWVLISGLLFTSLLGTFLLLLTGRHFETEAMVNERTAELLAAKNNAEEANKEKSRFISNISHELRTPLNGILGFTHLLQDKSYIVDDDLKKLNIIEHCSKHLLSLINDLLYVSRIETNKIKAHYKEFDFNDYLDDIISIFKLKSEEKGLELVVINQHHLNSIITDKKILRQINENLLSNAVKFTDQGSIKFSISNDDKHISFTVEDTGCGISEDNLKTIFAPFVQIDDKTFSKEGVGLGLAITQELISVLGGKISVSSQIDRGSCFTVEIPLITDTNKKQVSIVDKKNVPENGFKINILVADDNEINLMLFSHILDGIFCRYDIANDGREALELLQKNQYQLALIDLNMPVKSGMELMNEIKQQNINVTAVAISAYADQDNIDMALNAGFYQYLTKPVDAVDIKQLIEQMDITDEAP